MKEAHLMTAQLLSDWMEEDTDVNVRDERRDNDMEAVSEEFSDAQDPKTGSPGTYPREVLHKTTGALPLATSVPFLSALGQDQDQDQDVHMEDLCDEMMSFFTGDQHPQQRTSDALSYLPEDVSYNLGTSDHGLDHMSVTEQEFCSDLNGPGVRHHRDSRAEEYEITESIILGNKNPLQHRPLARSVPCVTIDLTGDNVAHEDSGYAHRVRYYTPDQGDVHRFRVHQVQHRRYGTQTPGRHKKMRQTSLEGWFKR